MPLTAFGVRSLVYVDGALPQFEAALRQSQSERAVAIAVSLCVKAGGVDLAPLELMRDHVIAAATSLDTRSAAGLVTRCLAPLHTVWPLRAALASLLFIDGIERAIPEAWRQMAAAASAEGRH